MNREKESKRKKHAEKGLILDEKEEPHEEKRRTCLRSCKGRDSTLTFPGKMERESILLWQKDRSEHEEAAAKSEARPAEVQFWPI